VLNISDSAFLTLVKETRGDGHSDYLISRIGDFRAVVMKNSVLWDIRLVDR
jgi:hypothetical protein